LVIREFSDRLLFFIVQHVAALEHPFCRDFAQFAYGAASELTIHPGSDSLLLFGKLAAPRRLRGPAKFRLPRSRNDKQDGRDCCRTCEKRAHRKANLKIVIPHHTARQTSVLRPKAALDPLDAYQSFHADKDYGPGCPRPPRALPPGHRNTTQPKPL
jgi:hypothetical protein